MIRAVLDAVSLWAIPVMLVGIPLVGLIRGVKVYDVFIEGAKEGFQVAVRIIPFLVGILVAIGMFRGSGAMDLLIAGLRPLLAATRFPAELLPLAVLRSLTGSGSLALDNRRHQDARPRLGHRAHGRDNVRSSETTFYVLAVYFGAVGVKSNAPCRACRTRRRHGRGDRGGGGVRVALLIAGSTQLSDFSFQLSAFSLQLPASGFRLPAASTASGFGDSRMSPVISRQFCPGELETRPAKTAE